MSKPDEDVETGDARDGAAGHLMFSMLLAYWRTRRLAKALARHLAAKPGERLAKGWMG